MEEILIQIEEQIKWLRDNSRTQDVDEMRIKNHELACNSYYLATLVGDAQQLMNDNEYFYKTSISSYIENNQGSVAAKENAAKVIYQNLYKDMVDAENVYNKLNKKLAQVNMITETVKQSIAQLRRESKQYGNA